MWVTKQEPVEVSDLERTIIDGLRQPEYCGGITEVAKGLWMRRSDIQVNKLLEYATRLGLGSVKGRLGYLLELYEIADHDQLESLRHSLGAAYVALDPISPHEGPHLAKWRLQNNISSPELHSIRSA
jgi:predicted transcriptional regulator of viral defense system